jgi:heat shock protein 5
LTPEEIEEMLAKADMMKEEDEKVAKRATAKVELESYVYRLKNEVADEEKLGGKLDDEEKETINDGIESTIEWLDENGETADAEEITEMKEKLLKIVQPITEKLYEGQEGEAQEEEAEEEDDEHDEL